MMATPPMAQMNPGDEETSYSRNSALQKFLMHKTWRVLDESLEDMFTAYYSLGIFPKCLKIVDLGCASGSNTLLLISHVVHYIEKLCELNKLNKPEFEVFLNDLPHNDFNNLFKILPSFIDRDNCFISALPRSFYGRLFPTNTLHFAYSSNALHWLSQIPEGVDKNNRDNICVTMRSPAQVVEAYASQYQRDFMCFLRCRGEEMIASGRMVLAMVGRPLTHKHSSLYFELLAQTLVDMVAEKLVDEQDLYSFNVPLYHASKEEVETIVMKEGSFNLERMESFLAPLDANDDNNGLVFDRYRSGKFVSDCVRALVEPILSHHFASSINKDDLFQRYTNRVAQYGSLYKSSYMTILVVLTKK